MMVQRGERLVALKEPVQVISKVRRYLQAGCSVGKGSTESGCRPDTGIVDAKEFADDPLIRALG